MKKVSFNGTIKELDDFVKEKLEIEIECTDGEIAMLRQIMMPSWCVGSKFHRLTIDDLPIAHYIPGSGYYDPQEVVSDIPKLENR